MATTTDTQNQQEALYLWDDTKRILARSVGTDRLRAMMDACDPVSLEGNVLTALTRSSFAKHSLDGSSETILEALSEAAFQPMELAITYEDEGWHRPEAFPRLITQAPPPMPPEAPGPQPAEPAPAPAFPGFPAVPPAFSQAPSGEVPLGVARTALSEDEFRRQFPQAEPPAPAPTPSPQAPAPRGEMPRSHLSDGVVGDRDSNLTFETFVEGQENQIALVAAKQVANGNTRQYNPLFIYGDSGLGKTHLLMSIKNYIAVNDPSRTCAYITASDFISDYTTAMAPGSDKSIKDALTESYRGVDVLILDDIQHLRNATATIEFFFDTFNYLISNGKQIVLAADEPPAELGMSERITSRMAQGFEVSIQLPALELKRNLVRAFYERYKADGGEGYEGEIPTDVLNVMAECCGNNIRVIKAYVQQSLLLASQLRAQFSAFTTEDAKQLAKDRWPHGHHRITVDEVQSTVEQVMGVGHAELVGSKRNKDIAQARHVAIWLCRQLTDNTYKDIGLRFGGRSHTTCLHSCEWVDTKLRKRTDRALIELVGQCRRRLEAL